MKNEGKFFGFPYISELPELFTQIFKKILRVGYQIPRLEYFMSRGIIFGVEIYVLEIGVETPMQFTLNSKIYEVN